MQVAIYQLLVGGGLSKNHNITEFHALSPFSGVKLGVDSELTPKLAITDYEWDYGYMMKHFDYCPCPKRGITRIKSFMFRGGYLIGNAIVDAARAAYVATLLEKGQTEIERYNGDPMSIASLEILPTLPNRLNRLKRQSPEAYYYWAKTSQLL